MKALALAAAAALIATAGLAAPAVPKTVAAAVANPDRPAADRARDGDRKPAEVIAFAGVQPGWTVADFIPGSGYFSRIFAKAVGPKGRVYAVYPTELAARHPPPANLAQPFPEDPNVTGVATPVNDFATPKPLDLVWLSDNYHDLHDPFFAPADLAKINAAVFRALKPGGIYLIIDHAAEPGSGLRDTDTLHRIDEQTVKAEVAAAGFVLVGESEALRNPADTHALKVFDPSIRGRTDQFVLKFRKPG